MPRITEVRFAPDVAEKLWRNHRLTQWEVEQLIFDPASEPRWDVNRIHGGRLIIRGRAQGCASGVMFVALRPIDPEEGVWDCITAFCPTERTTGRRNEMTKPSKREAEKEIAKAWDRGEPADIERKHPSSSVLSIRVSQALMLRLHQRARELGTSPGTVARELIQDGLAKDGERTPDDLARLFARWVEEAR